MTGPNEIHWTEETIRRLCKGLGFGKLIESAEAHGWEGPDHTIKEALKEAATDFLVAKNNQLCLLWRQKIAETPQLKAHIHLIKYALERNCTISVDGGGDELDLVDGSQFQQILDDVEACDITTMFINKNGKQVGWASVVLEYQQDPAETINDLSGSEFMDAWEEQYNKDLDAARGSI